MEKFIQVIREKSRTGGKGDGRIFVTEFIDAIRIRDGMRGGEAL